jgi:hypothetical protein
MAYPWTASLIEIADGAKLKTLRETVLAAKRQSGVNAPGRTYGRYLLAQSVT